MLCAYQGYPPAWPELALPKAAGMTHADTGKRMRSLFRGPRLERIGWKEPYGIPTGCPAPFKGWTLHGLTRRDVGE